MMSRAGRVAAVGHPCSPARASASRRRNDRARHRRPARPPEERVELDVGQVEPSGDGPRQRRLAGAARSDHVDPVHGAAEGTNGAVRASESPRQAQCARIWRPPSRARSAARPATDRRRQPPSAPSAARRSLRMPASGRAAWIATSSRTASAHAAPGGDPYRRGGTADDGRPAATSASSRSRRTRRRAGRCGRGEQRRDRLRRGSRWPPRPDRPSLTGDAPDLTRDVATTGRTARRWCRRLPPLRSAGDDEPPRRRADRAGRTSTTTTTRRYDEAGYPYSTTEWEDAPRAPLLGSRRLRHPRLSRARRAGAAGRRRPGRRLRRRPEHGRRRSDATPSPTIEESADARADGRAPPTTPRAQPQRVTPAAASRWSSPTASRPRRSRAFPAAPATQGCGSNARSNSGNVWIWVGFQRRHSRRRDRRRDHRAGRRPPSGTARSTWPASAAGGHATAGPTSRSGTCSPARTRSRSRGTATWPARPASRSPEGRRLSRRPTSRFRRRDARSARRRRRGASQPAR